jgi:hypothetical protein
MCEALGPIPNTESQNKKWVKKMRIHSLEPSNNYRQRPRGIPCNRDGSEEGENP